ncbi:MAG: endonuclease/exonuclease/phosphatase family protein, partial [Gemmatimonadales bacterium]
MTTYLNLLVFNILAPCWASHTHYDVDSYLLDRNYRRNRIIDTIQSSNADVVCLQEVTEIEFKAIRAGLPHFKGFRSNNAPNYWENWITEDTPWEPNGTAIFARNSKFTSLSFKDYALSESGNHATRLICHVNDLEVSIWSIHLDSDNPKTRSIELESLLMNETKGKEIIAGDYNINIDTSNLKYMLETRGFVNVLRKVGNFEPTHPFSSKYYQANTYSILDHVMLLGGTPISGDVLDNGVWSISDESKRIA